MSTIEMTLEKMGACSDARQWVKEMNGNDPEKLWNECQRGDWMGWLISKLKLDHRKITLVKARTAKLVIHLMCDERSRVAVDVAERYGLGEATREELDVAAAAAADAAAAAAYTAADAYTAAATAADAAAYAAYAAYAAAGAYTAADVAAYAAADAAAYAAYAAYAAAGAYTAADAYAAYAAYAAYTAADAAYTAAGARTKSLSQSADITHQIFSYTEVSTVFFATESPCSKAA